MNTSVKDGKDTQFLISIKYFFLFLVLVFVVSAVSISYISYSVAKRSNTTLVKQELDLFFKNFREYTQNYFDSGRLFLDNTSIALEEGDFFKDEDFDDSRFLRFLKRYTENFPSLSSTYFADTQGNFYMVKLMPDGSYSFRKILRTERDVRTIWEHSNPDFEETFVNTIRSLEEGYDPRSRIWFQSAFEKGDTILTPPYVFASDKLPGITFAQPVFQNLQDGKGRQFQGVLAADFGFRDISDKLIANVSESNFEGLSFFLNGQDEIMAFSGFYTPLFSEKISGGVTEVELLDFMEVDHPVLNSIDLKNPIVYDNEGIVTDFIDWIIGLLKPYFDGSKQFSDNKQVPLYHAELDGDVYLYSIENFLIYEDSAFQIGFVISEDIILGEINFSLLIVVVFSFVVSFLIMLFGFIVSNSITRSLNSIAEEMKLIQREFVMDFDKFYDSPMKEINYINMSFRSMKQGLRSFKKFVPSALVADLIKEGKEAVVGGEKREVTLFFSDVEGFTKIAEKTEPQLLMETLGSFFSEISKIIGKNKGTLDKYIGDGVMAFWGAPFHVENHALEACRSALECQRMIGELNGQLKNKGMDTFKTRIGLNSGEVVVGNLGSDERLNYTAMGDHVNLTSRLENINKLYGTKIIISEYTYNQAKDYVEVRLLDKVAVKGRDAPLFIFELIGLKNQISEQHKIFCKNYHQAIFFYLNQNWEKAIAQFKECLKLDPSDKPSEIFIKRCEVFRETPPGENWAGVFRFIR